MKKVLLMIGLVVAGYTMKAQDVVDSKSVPSKVSSALTQKYPDLKSGDIKWEKKDNNYKAEFTKDGQDYEVKLDNTGNWVSTEVDLTEKDLPEKVRNGLNKSDYKSWTVKDVEKKEKPQGKTLYKIEVKQGEQEYDVYFDQEGTLVKKNKS
ncbi:PepSY-like domain-containing protein [Sporocytophaga myxococcoides]|uniref:PepSY-like domain-containing protein n=1 Tax=Sporocytophaga myxococcoides TaxID=153721 RepID=UPI000417288A|nr:PepSY-like domain-containing protein [Sporocytophaga myxococcoides]